MRGFRALPALALLPVFLLAFPLASRSEGYTVFLLTQGKGILRSDDGGRWKGFNRGLPDRFIPLKITADPSGNLYLSTLDAGIYKTGKGSDAWESLNTDDFLVRYQAGIKRYRKISAIAADKERPGHLVLATKHTVYQSADGGKSWTRLPSNGMNSKSYVTALAARGKEPRILAGTSFNGIFRSRGGGFAPSSSGLPFEQYSKETSFHEEIAGIDFDETNTDLLFAGLNFGGGLYASYDGGRSWKALSTPFGGDPLVFIHDLRTHNNHLYVSTDKGVYKRDLKSGEWFTVSMKKILDDIPKEGKPLSLLLLDRTGKLPPLFYRLGDYTLEKNAGLSQRASGRKALYASIPFLRRRFPDLLSEIAKCRFNAVVIDMKDDFGDIYFPTKNRTALETGAARKPVEVESVLRTLRDRKFYSIARIVVFKDRALFRAYGNRYAIWNVKANAPWRGNDREYWVDPHSAFVRDYNVALARELEALGFDEIQFDYIRFPSDGPVGLCHYRYRTERDAYKSEVMTAFLREARSQLRVPLSVDIYGFNAWYRFGNSIGQDIEELAAVADVICPMIYPSHFGPGFYRKFRGDEKNHRLIFESGKRSLALTGNNAVIRPYLQAFNLLSPTWGPGYIAVQAEAAEKSGCSGYTFWNAKGEYAMVRRGLGK